MSLILILGISVVDEVYFHTWPGTAVVFLLLARHYSVYQ